MFDRQKIIIMSKLAVYDKNYAREDRKKAEYFRHDYVYRQNLGTRFYVFIGSVIVILFYLVHKIVIDSLDILYITDDTALVLIGSGIFMLLVQFFYSMMGMLFHSREYNDAQQRISEYFENLNKLEKRNFILQQKREQELEKIKRESSYGGNYGYGLDETDTGGQGTNNRIF